MSQPIQPYRRRVLRWPSPAAGADLAISPNGTGLWVVRNLSFALTTSAVVGSRYVTLFASDGTDAFWRSGYSTAQRPSTVERHVASAGAQLGEHHTEDFGRQATSVFAAGAAGSVSLANGDYATGFTISAQPVAAAVNVDITLTNVTGGTMTYRWVAPVLGGVLDVSLPHAIPGANGASAPTLNFPVAAGGPAYSLALYGLAQQLTSIESHYALGDGIVLPQGYVLGTEISGMDAADQISDVVLVIEEYPTGPLYDSVPMSTVYSEPIVP